MGKVANWYRAVVIDALFSFNVAAILYKIYFLFPLTPAESIVIGLRKDVLVFRQVFVQLSFF